MEQLKVDEKEMPSELWKEAWRASHLGRKLAPATVDYLVEKMDR